MVALPIAYDQPGVAARISHHGVGEFLNIDHMTVDHLFELIQKVLSQSSYRDRSRYFQKVIAETQGVDLAANVVEQALQTALNREL
jgi:UDP:flavonoid glycosyltransferase YjiC (YdhE family)